MGVAYGQGKFSTCKQGPYVTRLFPPHTTPPPPSSPAALATMSSSGAHSGPRGPPNDSRESGDPAAGPEGAGAGAAVDSGLVCSLSPVSNLARQLSGAPEPQQQAQQAQHPQYNSVGDLAVGWSTGVSTGSMGPMGSTRSGAAAAASAVGVVMNAAGVDPAVLLAKTKKKTGRTKTTKTRTIDSLPMARPGVTCAHFPKKGEKRCGCEREVNLLGKCKVFQFNLAWLKKEIGPEERKAYRWLIKYILFARGFKREKPTTENTPECFTAEQINTVKNSIDKQVVMRWFQRENVPKYLPRDFILGISDWKPTSPEEVKTKSEWALGNGLEHARVFAEQFFQCVPMGCDGENKTAKLYAKASRESMHAADAALQCANTFASSAASAARTVSTNPEIRIRWAAVALAAKDALRAMRHAKDMIYALQDGNTPVTDPTTDSAAMALMALSSTEEHSRSRNKRKRKSKHASVKSKFLKHTLFANISRLSAVTDVTFGDGICIISPPNKKNILSLASTCNNM